MASTARAGPGETRNFIHVSHVGTSTQVLHLSSATYLDVLAGSCIEVDQIGLKPAPLWDAGRFTRYTTTWTLMKPLTFCIIECFVIIVKYLRQ